MTKRTEATTSSPSGLARAIDSATGTGWGKVIVGGLLLCGGGFAGSANPVIGNIGALQLLIGFLFAAILYVIHQQTQDRSELRATQAFMQTTLVEVIQENTAVAKDNVMNVHNLAVVINEQGDRITAVADQVTRLDATVRAEMYLASPVPKETDKENAQVPELRCDPQAATRIEVQSLVTP